MRQSYHDRERAYQRRVLAILPVAAFLVFLLFVSSDVVPYGEIEKRLGWEGETSLLPEITIIPDDNVYEELRDESRLAVLSAVDIDMLNERSETEGFRQEVPEQEPEEIERPELDLSNVRHYEAHTAVPYSEDYVILHMVQPEYPPRELIDGIEADVIVEILVNEAGEVENAWILIAYGPQSFEDASLAAVRQFRFKPPVQSGRAMPMWIRFQIRFRLVS